ncbi:DoxX family protein [Herbiconiux sp. P17]|uniref:DoxX family protein n=1 Tax=Herbiconiux wuyangfengii TaxID=3342794 RepID=UPI0035B81043
MVLLVLSLILAVIFTLTASLKLLGVPYSLRLRDSLYLSAIPWRLIGGVELLGAAGLVVGIWIPFAGVAASVGLTVFMLGAAYFRLRGAARSGMAVSRVVAPVIGDIVLAGVVAFGLVLRSIA